MQLNIIDPTNKETGKKELPAQFSEEIRPDLIKRAYLALKSRARQPYGTNPLAGIRQSVRVSKRRRDYRGSYGIGISRIPRKVMVHRGSRFIWTGAFIPSTVGGRAAFPPKAEKVWAQKINTKERRKSLRSAISATLDKDLVSRKHKTPASYPFIISSAFESIARTKELEKALEAIGLGPELARTKVRKIRAGMGTMRGRKYQTKKGPLIVVAGDCNLLRAAKNILGLDIVDVQHINIDYLAPGSVAGRLTLWSESAINKMEEEHLFR